jgi:separase
MQLISLREDDLACAKALYSQDSNLLPSSQLVSSLEQRTQLNLLISRAYLVYSMLSLERGAAHSALAHAKQSVRLLRRAWTNTEEQVRRSTSIPDISSHKEVDKLAEEISQMSMSTTSINLPANSSTGQSHKVSSFWFLISPLFQSLNYLSELFAHHGMFQETTYYAEQAYNLVKEVGSEVHLSLACAGLGNIFLKAGILDKGSELLTEARQLIEPHRKTRTAVLVRYHLGCMHGILGDHTAELASYVTAAQVLDSLLSSDYISSLEKPRDSTEGLGEMMSQMTLAKKKHLRLESLLDVPKHLPHAK